MDDVDVYLMSKHQAEIKAESDRKPRRMKPNRDSRPIVLERFVEHDEMPECSIENFPYVKACKPVEDK